MPLQVIDGPTAVAIMKDNEFAGWPTRGDPDSRLEPFAKPHIKAGFQLVPGEAIFTVGSCFAREIEKTLHQYGFDLPTRAVLEMDDEFRTMSQNVLNNYGTPSILNEFSWALDPEARFPEEHNFFEIYPGKFVDIHMNPTVYPAGVELLRKRRQALTKIYCEAARCRVMIVTLGLSEVWFDTKTGLYINGVPRRMMVRREPDRFQLHVLNYQEAGDFLFRTFELLRKTCRPDLRVLLTVSPVPLQATYRAMDVMTANAYSKAVLRAVAEEAAARFEFVEYFPSYESVVLSERNVTWENDQIHPTAAAIENNCVRMLQAYMHAKTPAASIDDVRAWLTHETDARKAFGLVAPHTAEIEKHPDLAAQFCRIALQAKRASDARSMFPFVRDALPADEKMILEARIAFALGEAAETVAALSVVPERHPFRTQYFMLLARANAQLEHLQGLRDAAREWLAINPKASEPYRLLGVAHARAGDAARADNYFQQALDRATDQVAILLDYAEHLDRSGRRAEAEALMKLVDPTSAGYQNRLNRLRADI